MTQFDLQAHLTYLRGLSQEQPHLGNQYLEDTALREYLQHILPKAVKLQTDPIFTDLGGKVVNKILDSHRECSRFPPFLETLGPYGQQVNQINTGLGWKQQRIHSSTEGIVALSFEKDTPTAKYGEHRRLVQLVRLYLYSPSSGLYGCPLAMTDGCAQICHELLKEGERDKLAKNSLKKLEMTYEKVTSRLPGSFWTSGQWMTEKRGGSDVGRTTETLAVHVKDGKYKLYGYKFFCSAADSNVALTLARIIDPSRKYSQEVQPKNYETTTNYIYKN